MSVSSRAATGVIRTLVVDDSPFVRKVVREMLSRSPFIEVVGMARDGQEAFDLTEELKPDVITCDLTMPNVGGVEFVRRQMARGPVPILLLSASPSDADIVLQAIDAGAVDFVQKPTARASNDLLAVRDELIEKVKAAATAPLRNLQIELPSDSIPAAIGRSAARHQVDVIAIGISTGGPQALRYLIPQIPADLPVPLLIVLHMPVGYTALYATKLAELSKLKVKEAADGDLVQPGTVILAQAGRHMTLARNSAGEVRVRLSIQPMDKPHRPSVDVLFQSMAEIYGSRCLAIVMTGMGDDGKQGAAWIKAQGGKVLTEAEETCVIYGMPRCVDEAGLSDASVPLTKMADAIINSL